MADQKAKDKLAAQAHKADDKHMAATHKADDKHASDAHKAKSFCRSVKLTPSKGGKA